MSTNRLAALRSATGTGVSTERHRGPLPDLEPDQPSRPGVSAPPGRRFQELAPACDGPRRRRRELSLDEIKSLPARTQITAHVCEQGWSAIGEWTGAPLQSVLEAAGGVRPEARYVVIDTVDRWYEGYDMFEVVHPQTILAYGLNGHDLPTGNGAPLRLLVQRQCGYKNLKFLKSIRVVDSLTAFGRVPAASTRTSGSTGSRVSNPTSDLGVGSWNLGVDALLSAR